jgi:hypothetical protein
MNGFLIFHNQPVVTGARGSYEGPCGVGVSLPSSPTVPAPNLPSPAMSAPGPSQKIENRSDFGQKRFDSAAPTPQPAQPSALPGHPQPIWSLQPGEHVAEYQLFAAWIQLSRATSLKLPLPWAVPFAACVNSRLATKKWKTRAAAFDRHRAQKRGVRPQSFHKRR